MPDEGNVSNYNFYNNKKYNGFFSDHYPSIEAKQIELLS